ncbi:hypothetical protein [Oceanithermus sp.]
MRRLLERARSCQPRWLRLEVRTGRAGLRLWLPLEPFETPLVFALALAGWWARRRRGERGGWRALFEPPRLGLERLGPDEPLFEVKSPDAYVSVRVGGAL